MTQLTDAPTATTAKPWKGKDTLEGNPMRLPQEAAEALAPHLDEHVSSLFVLFHQYQKHHWLVEGPQFRDLHHFLEAAYTAVQKHADTIAERMTAIGAVPTSAPDAQANLAYIKHEPEGIYRIRDMLSADRELEGHVAERFRETIKLATSKGDFATETMLKGILVDVEDRAHELDHFLGHDTLSLWSDGDPDRGIADAAITGAAQAAAE